VFNATVNLPRYNSLINARFLRPKTLNGEIKASIFVPFSVTG
jgi:hypothetical protein